VNRLAKKDKSKDQTPVEPAVQGSQVWSESFESSDHNHFIQMSASAMQEAMNVAAKSGNVEHLLQVAQSWGNLAATVKDMARNRQPAGFTRDEDEKNG
jgi:hypothetical protein